LSFIEVDINTDWLSASYDIIVSPDGKHVYSCSYADDAVVVFRRNSSTGRLTYHQRRVDNTNQADGLEGPKQLAFSPDGSYLYIASRIEGALAIFWRSLDNGRLTYVDLVEQLDRARGPVGVAVSPDGKNVYIASNDSSTLSVTSRDLVTGRLRELETFYDDLGVDGLGSARAVAVSPDGKHVYVAGHSDDAIAIFDRNTADGGLAFYDFIQDSDLLLGGLVGIHSLTVSPTGAFLYAVSVGDDALVVFRRDSTTGALTFEQVLYDSDAGVDGLNDAYHVAVSSDGGHVYVAAYSDDSVSHFEWTKLEGLVHEYTFKDEMIPSIDGLDGANSVVISPDGKRLYVASRIDDAIVMFIRGTSSGLLGYHSMYKDGIGGVDGLNGVRAIAMNASGTYLYAASQHEHALAVFNCDTTYGDLTYFTHIEDTDPGIDGLRTANGIAVSPIFNHIYVAAYDDDAVSVFNHFWGIYVPMIVRE
jgi:6-phosphogluconolactonase (cycloisomerase 2 family)